MSPLLVSGLDCALYPLLVSGLRCVVLYPLSVSGLDCALYPLLISGLSSVVLYPLSVSGLSRVLYSLSVSGLNCVLYPLSVSGRICEVIALSVSLLVSFSWTVGTGSEDEQHNSHSSIVVFMLPLSFCFHYRDAGSAIWRELLDDSHLSVLAKNLFSAVLGSKAPSTPGNGQEIFLCV